MEDLREMEASKTKWILVFDDLVNGTFVTLRAALAAAGRASNPVPGNWSRIRVYKRRHVDPEMISGTPVLDLHRNEATNEFE